jgi:hypothetical protein
MGQAESTQEEWRRLFEAAIQFKRLGCWEWMDNDDYFVITDPETGETGYCVVLGAGGIDYGLNVYVGPKAGAFLQEISDPFGGSLGRDREELMYSTHAITVNFEDREVLDKEDLNLIRELGYKFRGSRQWPLFRSYEPGLIPWGLNGWQVRFLTVALEQTMGVAERFRENEELYFEHDEADEGIGEKRLHRVPQITESGIVWRDEWLPWKAEGSLIEPYTYPDEIRLQQIRNSLKKSNDIWETDFDYVPVAIGDRGERAFYPRLCLWVHQENGMILDAKILQQPDCREFYVAQMIALLEKANRKPARIETGSTKAYLALKNSAERIGIPLRVNPMVEGLLEAKEAIVSNL